MYESLASMILYIIRFRVQYNSFKINYFRQSPSISFRRSSVVVYHIPITKLGLVHLLIFSHIIYFSTFGPRLLLLFCPSMYV